MSTEQAIKAEALRLGFALAGLTTPDPPPHFGVFESWLEAGRHGEMAYLETERSRLRREDPRRILPECQTILGVGMRYQAPRTPGQAGEKTGEERPRGRIASYAWGDDYHGVLVPRLESLVAFIRARMGDFPYRVYSDTGPLLERELAQRAGLGWIGKNTCLINPAQGSYFLLGEALLGIALQPDLPFLPDRCGSCTRCLEACPTGCILPDRTLDARRCISYLTIELKGAIPAGLRPQMGNWIFGCDICQQVCPWNRFAEPEGDPAYAARPGLPSPDLIETLQLSEEAFREKFRGSPVKRARRGGYLRNAAVALGNSSASPDASGAAELAGIMSQEDEPLVRCHAAWALGQIGGPAAHQALQAALASEEDPTVREEIRAALAP